MSAHAKRLPEVATSVSAATDEEFSAHLAKPGLRVFDVHAKFAGPCEPMTNIFKRLKLDFGEHVVFVQATSDNITVLEPFRNQSCPAFLFFYNGVLVKLVRGANAPLIERTVREHVDLEKSGQPHPAIAIDEAVRPLAKLLGMSADGDPAPTAAAAAELDTAENAASVPAESTSRGLPSRAASAGRLADPAADDGVEDVDADDDAPAEQTLGIIKPEAMAPSVVEAVLSKLHHNRIKVLAKARVWLTRDGVRELYREHEGKEYFDRLVEYMSSAPVLVLHLSKPNCIQLWRDILGPKDPKTAKLEAPKTLRAQHGADPLMNAFHASDGPVSAARELAIFFQSPAEVPPQDGEGGEQQPTVPMLFTRMDDKDGEAAASGATGLPLKTVAIVKPDVAATTDGDAVEAIVRRVLAAGIAVQKRDAGVVLTGEQARVLAEAQVEDVPDDADEEERRKREERVDEVVVFLTSGPVVTMVLKGEDVVRRWIEMMGPDDPSAAKENFPMSIRALYGTDPIRNAVHGSATLDSALAEIQAFFPYALASRAGSVTHLFETRRASTDALRGSKSVRGSRAALVEKQQQQQPGKVEELQQTLALIKPDAYPGKKDEIVARIKEGGFTIVKEEEVHFSKEKAEEFYKEHKGKGFYEDLTNWMSSAPIYALILEKPGAITGWRELAGPTNSEKARETAPNSIRALFGTDGSQNAVHGSDSQASAVREIGVVFGGAAPAAEAPAEKQQTLALIKPDAHPGKKDEIVARIKEGGFTIVREEEVHFSKEKAEEFYKEHQGKGFYEDLTNWMSSAPIYALILEKAGAIAAWRELAGPTNSEMARETAPNSIRALFGTDGSQNAVHGSDSPASAVREIGVVFGGAAPASEVHAEMQQTLALIKPDAYPAKKEEIVARIKEGGFTIVREQEVHFSKENAEEFYKEHKGKGFYEDLTNWMSSAPIYAIVLEKPGAIAAWRELAGPTNSEKARETSPTSIRALFGTDGSQNAVHGSDSPASALREINVVFPDAAHQPPNPHPPPASRPASRPVSTRASLVASPKRAESTAGKSVRASVVAGLAAQPNEPAGAVGSRTASKAGSKVASKVVSKVGSKAGSKAASKKGSKTVSRSASGDKLDAGGGGGEAEAVPGGDEAPAS
ncbi:nucleoside diphosphate kinase [Zopfochytrium polystomum]|nr:nucleoside diphosphate kinase [Zopfochytrium polystomum]